MDLGPVVPQQRLNLAPMQTAVESLDLVQGLRVLAHGTNLRHHEHGVKI